MLQVAEVVWKESFTGDEIRAFIRQSVTSHHAVLVDWANRKELAEAAADCNAALANARQLGLWSGDSEKPATLPGSDQQDSGSQSLIKKGKLLPGADAWVELAVNAQHYSDEFDEQMVKVLRHIEIKRAACLPMSDGPEGAAKDLAHARVALAMIRFGKRTNDLRFLNTAMKLNDWTLMRLRKSRPSAATAKLLLSLSEQEIQLAELVR